MTYRIFYYHLCGFCVVDPLRPISLFCLPPLVLAETEPGNQSKNKKKKETVSDSNEGGSHSWYSSDPEAKNEKGKKRKREENSV